MGIKATQAQKDALSWACGEMHKIPRNKVLSDFHTRPLYYGTSLQNDAITEMHKDDYKRIKTRWD